ncbi:serine hydrolase domain-containing protein [Kordiimonas sp.]|uniref:serine hydrolase domain-containing protein n=1 Tax=Kordiimonas sp. TaxID=1970157 RepID=UPI003A958168
MPNERQISDTPIHGDCLEQFSGVLEAFTANFREFDEIGASVCVYLNGKKVVDLWGGYADANRTRLWAEDTLVNVWSTTKGIMSLCIARLNDQGLLKNDSPVADYWPEFGAHGKEAVTVAQLFSHQAGLCGLSQPVSEDTLLNTDALADLLAAEPPHWPIGTQSGYHALSIGPLADGLVKRVTGMTVGEYFRKEIAEPAGVDFHMGLSSKECARVAEIVHDGKPLNGGPETYNEYQHLALTNLPSHPELANLNTWRAQGMPSAGGQGNARSIAAIYGALAGSRILNGVELVSEKALNAATAIQIEGEDLVLRFPVCWGVGFAMNKGMYAYGPHDTTFGHHGWGGSFGFADPEYGLGVGYAMNYMREADGAPDPRAVALLESIFASI